MTFRSIALALLVALAGCSTAAAPTPAPTQDQPAADFASPEDTLRSVIRAINERDIAAYKQCFGPTAITRDELGIGRYTSNPDRFWSELEGTFRGPQTLVVETIEDAFAKGSVTAPEAEGGGIGSIAFERVGGEWKIRAW